jgi:hypothetical protein
MLPKAAAGHTSAAFAQNLPLVDLGLVRSEPDFNGTGSNLIAKRHATKHEASCCGGAGAFSGMRAGRVHAPACLEYRFPDGYAAHRPAAEHACRQQ